MSSNPKVKENKCEGNCPNTCKVHDGKFIFCSNAGCKCHNPQEKGEYNYERDGSHNHCWEQKGENKPACGQPLEKHKQCCLCDTPIPPTDNGWESRFDKEMADFPVNTSYLFFEGIKGEKVGTARLSKIKSFISKEIQAARQSERESIIGEIEKMKNNKCPVGQPTGFCCNYHYYLDDIIHLIRERK